jgi:predicted ATPase
MRNSVSVNVLSLPTQWCVHSSLCAPFFFSAVLISECPFRSAAFAVFLSWAFHRKTRRNFLISFFSLLPFALRGNTNTAHSQDPTKKQVMGAGLATARGDVSPVGPKATAPATPLTSVEHCPPRRVTTTSSTVVAAAATAPLPPASPSTANPRQHLTDTHASTLTAEPMQPPPTRPPRTLAALHDAATPRENSLQLLHGQDSSAGPHPQQPNPPPPLPSPEAKSEEVSATPPPSDYLRPPPTVLDTAVKRLLESSEGDAAVTNPNADDNAGEECRCMPCDEDLREVSHGKPGRDHTELSPSPDAPEHGDDNDVHGQPEPLEEEQTSSSPLITAPGHAAALSAGRAHDAMIYRPITRSVSPGQALGLYDGLPLSSVQQVLEAKHKVYRICLTGGPCAGKSTMLSAMQAKLPQRTGFRVMCVPEAATLLVTGGMQWDSSITVAQQSALLRTQLALEDQFYALAVASGVPTIIVSDRGTMDGRAFCTDAQFQEILRSIGGTIDALRDRYDAVLHMVTAANGAEEFYNLDNPARYEDLDGARASDLRLQEMYVGHPMFRLLDNSTTFEDKIERGLQVVGQVVHSEQCAPATPSFYLVRRCPPTLPVASASYKTYTTVLSNSQMNDIRLLVKREMPDGSCMHFFKSVKDMAGMPATTFSAHSTPRATSRVSNVGASFRSSMMLAAGAANQFVAPSQQRIESAQRISSREYNSLKRHRDRARAEVVMHATHFIYESSNYELTTLLAPSWAAGRQTLSVESCSPAAAAAATQNGGGAASALRLPPFLEVDREVPVESLTTAFLISHRETGALYTSLAFAPVFSRAVVTALGAHADTENILNSTLSTPRGPSALRAETSAVLASPVGADTKKEGDVDTVPAETGATRVELASAGAVPSAPAVPVHRGLGSLNVNTVPTSSSMIKSTPKKAVDLCMQQEVTPVFLGGSISVRQPRNVVTPSRFSLSGEEERDAEVDGDVTAVAHLAGEHAQPERRMFARDPESILPPIEHRKHRAH